MGNSTMLSGDSLEKWNSAAFLLTGIVVLVTVVLWGLAVLANWEGIAALVNWIGASVWLLFGLLFAAAGLASSAALLGLYPRLESHVPGLARIGAVFSVIAGMAALLVTVLLGRWWILGAGPTEFVGTIVILSLLLIVGGIVFGLVVFGFACWETDTPSRTIGTLLLVGGSLFLVPLSDVALEWGSPPDWLYLVVFGLFAIILLLVGYRLRVDGELTEREDAEPPIDPTGR